MSKPKTIWGFVFRLFPCPTKTGLLRIGDPGPQSPVLLTCNFHNTVERVIRSLRGRDAWLLVADSRGINVWCAAGADEFNTRAVVSAVKVSEVAKKVSHRRLILPPLCAPGVVAQDVEEQTGWTVCWGPVRAKDLPPFLDGYYLRGESMKRATFGWRERLDASVGSMFSFYLLIALGFLVFARHLLLDYLWSAAAATLLFMLVCPWIPGKAGWKKVVAFNLVLGCALILCEIFLESNPVRAPLIIAMASLFVFGSELGGVSSTMPSEFDPWVAKLGIKKLGNTYFAGTVRAELLAGMRKLTLHRDRCVACGNCAEICPQGVWELGQDQKAKPVRLPRCTACRACLVQCRGGAITADRTTPETAARL